MLVHQISASVPQYVDCNEKAQTQLSDRTSYGLGHTHTPKRQLECYTLIFPLYIGGRSVVTSDVRIWILRQLQYMGSHFNIRNAAAAAQVLERNADVDVWEVYAMLGSYAYAS